MTAAAEPTLFDPDPPEAVDVRVECFFLCGRTVTGEPEWAHGEMQRHYRDEHPDEIRRIVGP